ncbi:hypothetical protein [Streptomyces coerulescens]|uniref:Uncharacterized protein n=1 Tax=Streptomyces coerulescens TaxID=29304 RepID=A0ABW0CPF7_STRCD
MRRLPREHRLRLTRYDSPATTWPTAAIVGILYGTMSRSDGDV